MKIDHLCRQLQSDPDNVELARRLWNVLSRTEIVKGLKDLDITAPSTKTWKTIVKVLHESDNDSRRLIIDVLKPILRAWPTGFRKLPRVRGGGHRYYSPIALFKSGAWELCDSIDHRLYPNEYNSYLNHGQTELRELNCLSENLSEWQRYRWEGHFSEDDEFDPDSYPIHGAFPRLRKLSVDEDEDLFEFLCRESCDAITTCKSLQSLRVHGSWSNLEQLFNRRELRSGLLELHIELRDYNFSSFCQFHWPDIQTIVLEVHQLEDIAGLSVQAVRQALPKLASVRMIFDEDYSPMTERHAQLIRLLKEVCQVQVSLSIPAIALDDRQPPYIVGSIAEAVTRLHLDLWDGCFLPPKMHNVAVISISEWASKTLGLSLNDFIGLFCDEYRNIRSLRIAERNIAVAMLSSEHFQQLSKLDSLSATLVINRENTSQMNQLFANIARLKLKTLRLSIETEPGVQISKIEFPKSLTHLELKLETCTHSLKNLLDASSSLRALSIACEQLNLEGLVTFLNHENVQSVEFLQIYDSWLLDTDSLDPRSVELIDSIKLPNLKSLKTEIHFKVSSEEHKRLFCHFFESQENLIDEIPPDGLFSDEWLCLPEFRSP